MKKIVLLRWVIVALLMINLCAVGGVIVYLCANASNEAQETKSQYTIYIGTNDKDTYKQEISLDEAKNTVNEICAKYADGYTSYDAEGGWVDEAGVLTQEKTLVYSFTDVQEETIKTIMDEVLDKLNQNSILVEHSDVHSYYYYGQ